MANSRGPSILLLLALSWPTQLMQMLHVLQAAFVNSQSRHKQGYSAVFTSILWLSNILPCRFYICDAKSHRYCCWWQDWQTRQGSGTQILLVTLGSALVSLSCLLCTLHIYSLLDLLSIQIYLAASREALWFYYFEKPLGSCMYMHINWSTCVIFRWKFASWSGTSVKWKGEGR